MALLQPCATTKNDFLVNWHPQCPQMGVVSWNLRSAKFISAKICKWPIRENFVPRKFGAIRYGFCLSIAYIARRRHPYIESLPTLIGERVDNKSSKMYDIVPLFGEVIAAFLAVMMLVFVTLLCMARSRAYTSEVQATNVALVSSPTYEVQATNVVLVPSPTDSALNLKNLSSELATVIDWFSLGINLGLQKHELTKIERDYQGNDRRRVEMLYLWLQRTPNGTWEDVVDALQQMGANTVAENIREKYIRGKSKFY